MWRLTMKSFMFSLCVELSCLCHFIYTTRGYAIGVCGTNTLTANSGSFASPDFPATYMTSSSCTSGYNTALQGASLDCYSECSWTIKTTNGFPVRLVIGQMSIDSLNFCNRNYIEVFDGSSGTNRSNLITTACGHDSTEPLYSTGDTMFVRLISAHSNGRKGHRFNASWTTECFRLYTQNQGSIQSLGFPNDYTGDIDCTYVIQLQRGYNISFNVISFNLDPTVVGTCQDYVKIYDGGSDVSPILGGPYCGVAAGQNLVSSRHVALIKFRSDSTTASGSTGFNITYLALAPECVKWSDLPATGNLTSPGYPEPYPQVGQCRWRLDSGSRDNVVALKFLEIELGSKNDVNDQGTNCDSPGVATEVAVYDGDTNASASLLARYCRRNAFSPVITSNQQYLTVVFTTKNLRSDVSWQGNTFGFKASYSSVQNPNYFGSAVENVDLIFYGAYVSDSKLTKTLPKILERTKVVTLDAEIPIGKSLKAKYVYIHQDGMIGFSNLQSDTLVLSNSWQQPPCGSRSSETVCAYCACVNIDNNANADVYYNLHNKNNATVKAAIFDKVNGHVNKFKGTTDFDASIVLVVTWFKVQRGQETSQNTRAPLSGDATFQLIISASLSEAYAISMYKNNNMKWVVSPNEVPTIDIGVTTFLGILRGVDPKCQDSTFSRTSNALKMDTYQGNTGYNGAWVYKLGEVNQASANQECQDWYNANTGTTAANYRKTKFPSLPQCPCRLHTSRDSLGTTIWLKIARN